MSGLPRHLSPKAVEEYVLGAYLQADSPDRERVRDLLSEKMFTDPWRKKFWRYVSRADWKDSTDHPLAALLSEWKLEEGLKYRDLDNLLSLEGRVEDVLALVPHGGGVVPWAIELIAQFEARRLSQGLGLHRQLIESGVPVEEVAPELASQIEETLKKLQFEEHIASTRDDAISFEDEQVVRRESGIWELDGVFSGFFPGQLLVIAARPGDCKTTLALNMMHRVTARSDSRAFIQSMETSSGELLQKLKRLNKDRERTGEVFVSHEVPVSVNTIHRNIQRYRPEYFAIDYLGLMDKPKGSTIADQVGKITRNLKLMAMESKCCIILLVQLNREADKSDRPRLAHLRDSGAIEADADCVMMLRLSKDQAQLQGWVEKQRGGKRGEFFMRFSEGLFLGADLEGNELDG